MKSHSSHPISIPLLPILLTILLLAGDPTRQAAAQDTARFDAIGDLPGGAVMGTARGVSADGSIVVGFSNTGSGNTGFTWTETDGLLPLAAFPDASDHRVSDVSADGSMIAGWAIISSPTSGGWRALLWSGGGVSALASYTVSPPVPEVMVAQGISADGSVIAGFGSNTSNQYEAARWSGGAVANLGFVPGGDSSPASDISPDGSVIVGYDRLYYSQTQPYSVAWRSINGGAPQSLGTGGNYQTSATGVSRNGEVIIGTLNTQLFGPVVAARWTDAGGWRPLQGTVGNSHPNDVTPDGKVIVGEMGGRAFIWTEERGARDIQQLLEEKYKLDLTGWTLTRALAISDSGYVVVGEGAHGGGTEAWRAVVPMGGITRPSEGELWIAGETDTLRWIVPWMDSVDISLSIDADSAGNGTFESIEFDYPADSGYYAFNIPDSIVSRRCVFRLRNSADPGDEVLSDLFRIKPYVLTRTGPGGNYEAFRPNVHGWSFANTEANMWPPGWWSQFLYQGGVDPYTNLPYPQEDPFDLAWAADFIDWPLFVDLFGASQCYFSVDPPVYVPSAAYLWRENTDRWKGSCAGFAFSTLLDFGYEQEFLTAFPGVGVYVNLHDLPLTDNRRMVINELWFAMNGRDHWGWSAKNTHTPLQTLQEIKDRLMSDDRSLDAALYIKKDAKAHAVVPYRVLPVNPPLNDFTYVYINDSNYPGDSTKVILVDSANNTWDYPEMGWGGALGFYLMDPTVKYLQTPVVPLGPPSMAPVVATAADELLLTTNPNASITITDAVGDSVGFRDSSVYSTIDGATPVIPITSVYDPPAAYVLPSGDYGIRIDDVADSVSRFTLFEASSLMSYRRNGALDGETDLLSIDGSALTYSNPDPVAKTVSMKHLVRKAADEREFNLAECEVSPGDTLITELTPDEPSLLIRNRGTGKTYTLKLLIAGTAGLAKFRAEGIQLDAGARHDVRPVWNDISAVPILIDLDDDGSVDDTLLANNQLTGVLETYPTGIPSNLALRQNYPNPFNPSTEIGYGLPERSRVSLKVYDLLGREVAALVDRQEEAGYHAVRWDASGVPAGVYVYRLVAGDHSESRKMVVLK